MDKSLRRTANTETIRHLWDAIVYSRQQRQTPILSRISNYMKRKKIEFEDLEKQLDCAVKDGMIELKTRVGYKGSKVGIEQDSFKLPEKDVVKDGHDWYCFSCHKEGEVVLCSSCHRVYHEDCLTEPPDDAKKFICEVCKMNKSKDGIKIDRDDLNLLLSYTCLHLKEKAVNNREILTMSLSEEEKWRHNFLIYETMDLSIMEDKTQENVYKRIEEFQADAQTMVHNIVLYYGVNSASADMARLMLRDCSYDLSEIRQCRDCYRTSNEKGDKHWFCQPCDPAHELVYARQKGFPFWPAKVIRVNNGVYDVRFFGSNHQRANVEKENIRPITTSWQQLQLKRSVTLNKALEELKRHQQLLGKASKDKKTKKTCSSPPSDNSSRSNSATRRSRKSSVSSDDDAFENEVEDGSSSQDDCPSSSSAKIPRFKDAPTPEDHNVVSSSCQESSPCAKITVSTQTHKKLLASLIPPKPVKLEEKEIPPCDCEPKYSKMFKEFKERMETEQKEEKERSLRELAERLHTDFEEEKKRIIATAIEKVEVEMNEQQQESDNRLKAAHDHEMKEVVSTHKSDISEVKKKQWCYNCETEAIYHCCWNTSYCSLDCQQVHWHKEHKRTCRRKR